MQPDLTFTAATTPDIDALVALINCAYRGDSGWTRETDIVAGNRIHASAIERVMRNPHNHLMVARIAGEITACVCIEHAGNHAQIGTFAVTPTRQGQGIGKQVLHLAEAYATHQLGVTHLTLTVITQRPELIAFYERRGYRRNGSTSAFPVHLDVGEPLRDGLTVECLEKST